VSALSGTAPGCSAFKNSIQRPAGEQRTLETGSCSSTAMLIHTSGARIQPPRHLLLLSQGSTYTEMSKMHNFRAPERCAHPPAGVLGGLSGANPQRNSCPRGPHARRLSVYLAWNLSWLTPSSRSHSPPPPPPSRTNRTRLVPPPVLTGHVSSLLPYLPAILALLFRASL
jgi:hypothetical protein